jgi:hypothetical protein
MGFENEKKKAVLLRVGKLERNIIRAVESRPFSRKPPLS